MPDMDTKLPQAVSHIQIEGKEVYIVGTAHVSKESVQDVRAAIQTIRPDTVAVELCRGRYLALTAKDAWRELNIFTVLRQKKGLLLLSQLIMSAFYRRLGEKLAVVPGAEMLEAAQLAERTGASLILADRNIEITLKRVWGYLNFIDKLRLLVHLSTAVLFSEEIDEKLVEKIKTADQLENLMEMFARKFPEIKKRLIDERDLYIAQQLRRAPGSRIVAVVGAGHVAGIRKHIEKDEPTDWLLETPAKSVWPKILTWAVPAGIIALFAYGFCTRSTAHSVQNVYIWILVNGFFAAAGAAAALPHPLTVLTAFAAAPLTSINPFLASGWVAAVVQAWVARPRVADFEKLAHATASVKAFWENPVTKILLVAALANLGGTLGIWIAAAWIASRTL